MQITKKGKLENASANLQICSKSDFTILQKKMPLWCEWFHWLFISLVNTICTSVSPGLKTLQIHTKCKYIFLRRWCVHLLRHPVQCARRKRWRQHVACWLSETFDWRRNFATFINFCVRNSGKKSKKRGVVFLSSRFKIQDAFISIALFIP